MTFFHSPKNEYSSLSFVVLTEWSYGDAGSKLNVNSILQIISYEITRYRR
jgi:hypothetical protein